MSLHGLMTDPPSTTATPSHNSSQACTTPSNAHGPPATKSLVKCHFDLAIRMFFLTPTTPTKFNPITTMKQLFRTMLKDELSLVICNSNNDKQIILTLALLPTGKTKFKKFFKVSTVWNEQQKQEVTHVHRMPCT